MKKSVVILIALIFIASVVSVSFFGLQFKTFEEIVYVESIELLDENLKVDENGDKYVVIRPDENGERKYQIKYRVHPDNATDDGVRFAYDECCCTSSVKWWFKSMVSASNPSRP